MATRRRKDLFVLFARCHAFLPEPFLGPCRPMDPLLNRAWDGIKEKDMATAIRGTRGGLQRARHDQLERLLTL
jgi:hypothetical protein